MITVTVEVDNGFAKFEISEQNLVRQRSIGTCVDSVKTVANNAVSRAVAALTAIEERDE